jgi:hypothetical protein
VTAFAETHEGSIKLVNDAHGYSIGYTASCTCGWESYEEGHLREREGQAANDLLHHLLGERKGKT